MKYGLAWLLGIPIPILAVVYLVCGVLQQDPQRGDDPRAEPVADLRVAFDEDSGGDHEDR